MPMVHHVCAPFRFRSPLSIPSPLPSYSINFILVSSLVWSGEVVGALATANVDTTVIVDVGFDSTDGFTKFISHVKYDNHQNLRLALDLDYQPKNCSVLSTGTGSLSLYLSNAIQVYLLMNNI